MDFLDHKELGVTASVVENEKVRPSGTKQLVSLSEQYSNVQWVIDENSILLLGKKPKALRFGSHIKQPLLFSALGIHHHRSMLGFELN